MSAASEMHWTGVCVCSPDRPKLRGEIAIQMESVDFGSVKFDEDIAKAVPRPLRSLLRQHFRSYSRLASGTLEPKSTAQRHFISTCYGETTPASEHECAYILYVLAWYRAEHKRLEGRIGKLEHLNAEQAAALVKAKMGGRQRLAQAEAKDGALRTKALELNSIRESLRRRERAIARSEASLAEERRNLAMALARVKSERAQYEERAKAAPKPVKAQKLSTPPVITANDKNLDKYGIPEFEEGGPRPGWKPLGKFE